MVKEKLNIIKRFFFIYLTHFLLNLKINDRCLFLILVYAQLVVISLLFLNSAISGPAGLPTEPGFLILSKKFSSRFNHPF